MQLKRCFAALTNGTATSLVAVKIRQVPQNRISGVNGIENFVQPVAALCMAQLLALLGGWRDVYTLLGALMLVLTAFRSGVVGVLITVFDGEIARYWRSAVWRPFPLTACPSLSRSAEGRRWRSWPGRKTE